MSGTDRRLACSWIIRPRALDHNAKPSRILQQQQALGAETLPLAALEDRLLREAVEAAGGNLAAAARRLGLTRAQLAYRLENRGAATAR